MKRMMSIAAIALFLAGSSAFACDTCGCKAKKDEGKKPACSAKKECGSEKACSAKKECDSKKGEKKCAEGCTKACCAKKAEAK